MINKQRHHQKRGTRLENGQSLVEITISFLFFIFFLLGLLDLGRAYYLMVALEDSAGEAATFLSVNPDCDVADAGSCANPNNAEWRAANAVGDQLDWSSATINVSYPTVGTGTGNQVRVRIDYPFSPITPIISNIAGGNLTLSGDATQIILVE
jgi:Flp pilus assembly protein TadG